MLAATDTKHHTQRGLRGELSLYEPLARLSAWRVGGPAQRLYRPADLADLAEFLRQLPAKEPLLWLGLGNNILIRDGGVRGTVIVTSSGLNSISLSSHQTVRAEAGVPCAKIARFSARHSLSGAEFLAAIPGTLGSTMSTMPQGTDELWHCIKTVETIDRTGRQQLRMAQDWVLHRQYQDLTRQWPNEWPEEWFVAAHLQLQEGDAEQSLAQIRQFLEQRSLLRQREKQDCINGQIFRDPPGENAARLIDLAGLKGLSIGGASVSRHNANMFCNDGTATAAELEQLIEKVQVLVAEAHGIILQQAIHIVGEHQRIV